MRLWMWRILGAGVVVAVGLSSLVALQREGFFRIQEVRLEVENVNHEVPPWLSERWRDLTASVSRFRGLDLWSLDLSQVQENMNQLNWVRVAEISRRWPATLRVVIETKNIVFYGRGAKGSLLPILEDGTVLNEDFSNRSMSLPVLSDDFPIKDKSKVQQAMELLNLIPQKDSALVQDRVSEIGFDNKQGFSTVLFPFGTKVFWGHQDFPLKISRVNQVVDYLDQRQIEARVIDADLAKKVVVRLRKSP